MTAVRMQFCLSACIAIGLLPIARPRPRGTRRCCSPASGIAWRQPSARRSAIRPVRDRRHCRERCDDALPDRYATNEPVVDAKIDIEAGPLKGSAQANPGRHLYVQACRAGPTGPAPRHVHDHGGGDSDLLAGELVIGDRQRGNAHANDDSVWKRWLWAAGALVLLAGIARSRGGRAANASRESPDEHAFVLLVMRSPWR